MIDRQHSPQNRLHAFIEGRVQGVGFRFFVNDLASQLDLTGWVRNTEEEVEVVAEGARENLDILLQYLKRGPRAAYVTNVRFTWELATGSHKGFSVNRIDHF
jgi:acylphosphatase